MNISSRTEKTYGKSFINKAAKSKILIIGAGGTGMNIFNILTRTGFKSITIIDGDEIEESNLNRISETNDDSIGKPKVAIAKKLADIFGENDNVYIESNLDVKTATKLHGEDFDIVISALDNNHTARLLAWDIAIDSSCPFIDAGLSINNETEDIKEVARVYTHFPNQQCPVCARSVSTEIASIEAAKEDENNDYFTKDEGIDPSIMHLNMFVASVVSKRVIDIINGKLIKNEYLNWNNLSSSFIPRTLKTNEKCDYCSKERIEYA